MIKLLIDIGNTNTSLAILGRGKIQRYKFIHTAKKEVSPKALKRLLKMNLPKIDEIVIVSVVPRFLKIIKSALEKIAPGIKITVVGKDLKVPIANRYRKPAEVGQDRLVTAFSAFKKCGSPVIAIDFGTALTMDYVSNKGEYMGGLIFPGLRLALKSLVRGTALLPKVYIEPTTGFIGRDTKGSMNNGILYGYAAMCDGLIEEFRERFGKSVKVVATGGDAKLVARYSKHIKKVSPDLIFEGLCLMMRDTGHVSCATKQRNIDRISGCESRVTI